MMLAQSCSDAAQLIGGQPLQTTHCMHGTLRANWRTTWETGGGMQPM